MLHIVSLVKSIIVLSMCLFAWSGSAGPTGTSGPIESDSAAVARADGFTGVGQFYEDEAISRPATACEIATYRDSTTLNLHEQLDGRRAWKVSYPQFEVVLCHMANIDTVYASPKTCDIWIDSATGELLLVDIRPSDSSWTLLRPSEREVAFTLSFRGKTYLGLPDVMPTFRMMSVLAKCRDYLVHGDEAVVHYVMMPEGEVAAPFWVVYMKGVGFTATSQDGAPQILATAVMMNALTGESPPLGTTHYSIGSFDDSTQLSRQVDSATNVLRKRYEDHSDN